MRGQASPRGADRARRAAISGGQVRPDPKVLFRAGRKHHGRGELFEYDLYSSALTVSRPDGTSLFSEKLVVQPWRHPVRQAGMMGGFDIAANVILATPPRRAATILEQVVSGPTPMPMHSGGQPSSQRRGACLQGAGDGDRARQGEGARLPGPGAAGSDRHAGASIQAMGMTGGPISAPCGLTILTMRAANGTGNGTRITPEKGATRRVLADSAVAAARQPGAEGQGALPARMRRSRGWRHRVKHSLAAARRFGPVPYGRTAGGRRDVRSAGDLGRCQRPFRCQR